MTYDLPTLRDLLVRVEAAAGADRELDVDIMSALGYTIEWKQSNYTMEQYPVVHWDGTRKPCPQITPSIDAAVALIERVFPERLHGGDAIWGVNNLNERGYATLIVDHVDRGVSSAATPALALIAALLNALIAREEGREPDAV